jgi:hypothetical protein
MLQQTKEKELIAIIKSGLVGALAFTGVSFIWVIVSMFQGPRGSVVVTTFMNSPKFDFAKEALIVIICIGFMLGVLLRRCFPIMQRKFFLLVTMLVMIIVPLGFVIYFFHQMWVGTELPPVNLKLADCTNNVMNIHLKIPVGHDYRLDLETPETQVSVGGETNSLYNFSGHLRISSDGALIADLPIGSDKAWRNGPRYGLTGAGMQNTNAQPLSKFIQSHKSYDFEIIFEPPPPPGSSIWLFCLVSVQDGNQWHDERRPNKINAGNSFAMNLIEPTGTNFFLHGFVLLGSSGAATATINWNATNDINDYGNWHWIEYLTQTNTVLWTTTPFHPTNLPSSLWLTVKPAFMNTNANNPINYAWPGQGPDVSGYTNAIPEFKNFYGY